ncbi:hypothetical protein CLAFUW4_06363 [Fulvia fulva]|uniref:Uncharacterized protein n=1 Tax=Passalora fulva TaxID=5499 RepID=A0A9Q8LH07_PASFU|nr:uncharacterized protein CLAFUR5_06507 [Fulvia fulva]KAK4623618.1 hypothetical protein CLAFUR4_06366 [Fulvia fulva]KAK4625847.1 hypothetical protein CLAFUR0_06368 [Fulvia fulva]UJO17302.1 hypothetical protein CLAFUR5_06507 [Fulvia fulva]WPV15309.1 hypothetical protein CLAFUW4_06363 [Fulvia fulva]WPV30370.1 hypothetical protein CLAFUW7_06361 [Fulvia fulva]
MVCLVVLGISPEQWGIEDHDLSRNATLRSLLLQDQLCLKTRVGWWIFRAAAGSVEPMRTVMDHDYATLQSQFQKGPLPETIPVTECSRGCRLVLPKGHRHIDE